MKLTLIILFLFCGNLQAIELSVLPLNPKPRQQLVVFVDGEWGNNCIPQNQRVEIVDNHIRMYATVTTENCNKSITPYQLKYYPNNWMRSLFTAVENYYFLEFYITINDNKLQQLFAFDVIRIQHPNQYHLAPEGGFWWVDAEGEYGSKAKGSGFSIDRQNDHLTVMAQFYNSQGQPIWYYSEGQLDRGVYQADLKKIMGGHTLDAISNVPQKVESAGTLYITFNSQSHGTAWIVNDNNKGIMSDVNLQPISIKRYQSIGVIESNVFKGDWVLVAENTQSETATQRFQFLQSTNQSQQSQQNQGSWLIKGLNSRLLCKVTGELEKQAESCVLQQENGKDIALFDDIGLDKLLGIYSDSGERVQLIKIK